MKNVKLYRWYPIISIIAVMATANAFAIGLPWNDHDKPFNFFFDNNFDSHQQSTVSMNSGKLTGFLYITFTGGTTLDLQNAHHGIETVGWLMNGAPAHNAIVLEASGLHPIWCIDPDDMPSSPGYSHFHWFGDPQSHAGLNEGDIYDGYLLKFTAVDDFYFEHGGFPITPGIDDVSHYNIVIDYDGNGCADS